MYFEFSSSVTPAGVPELLLSAILSEFRPLNHSPVPPSTNATQSVADGTVVCREHHPGNGLTRNPISIYL